MKKTIRLKLEYKSAELEDHGLTEPGLVTAIQELMYNTKYSLDITLEKAPNVTVPEIETYIERLYVKYKESPNEQDWWDIKLMEAIRRDYE